MPVFTYGTILEEVQDALVQLSQPKPVGVYDSADKNAILMGALANTIGPLMLIQAWQQFREPFDVIGDGVETSFDLPDGFSRIIDDTGWSHAQRRPVVVVTAVSWAAVKAWLGQSFYINPAARIFDDQIHFLTPPADGDTISFEIVNQNWVLDGDGVTRKYRLDSNTDKPLYDSQSFMLALKLKWAGNKGLPTQEYQQDFDERWSQMTQYNQMGSRLSLNGGSLGNFRYLNGGNMPNTGYGG